MIKIYVDWENEEILTEREMNQRRCEMLDLKADLGRSSFKQFYEYGGPYAIVDKLIEVITAKDRQEVLDSIGERYAKYVDNQLIDAYEEIILD